MLTTLLFEITATDLATYVFGALALFAIALLACERSASPDPIARGRHTMQASDERSRTVITNAAGHCDQFHVRINPDRVQQ